MYCSKCGVQNPDDATFCSGCGSQLGTGAVVVSKEVATHYAGFWRRFVAVLLDSVILAIGGFIIGGIFGFMIGAFLGAMGTDIPTIQAIAGGFGYVLGIVLNWLYFTLLESSSKQATLGKMALGIVVTDLNGNRISFGRATGRHFGKIISGMILCIGFLMAGFTKKKQALHDIIAGCLVVRKRGEKETKEASEVSEANKTSDFKRRRSLIISVLASFLALLILIGTGYSYTRITNLRREKVKISKELNETKSKIARLEYQIDKSEHICQIQREIIDVNFEVLTHCGDIMDIRGKQTEAATQLVTCMANYDYPGATYYAGQFDILEDEVEGIYYRLEGKYDRLCELFDKLKAESEGLLY